MIFSFLKVEGVDVLYDQICVPCVRLNKVHLQKKFLPLQENIGGLICVHSVPTRKEHLLFSLSGPG